MIVEWFLDFLHGLAVAVFSWCSQHLPSPPDFIAQLSTGVSQLVAAIPSPVLDFLPVGPCVAIGAALAALVVGAGLVRLARRVLSLFTGGGGNA